MRALWLPLALAGKNVLYIVTDDLRPDLGCFGLPRVTPGLDALAAEGVLFDRVYAQQALCGPSRNSFMSGRRPDVTKSYNQQNHFRQVGPDWTSLPGGPALPGGARRGRLRSGPRFLNPPVNRFSLDAEAPRQGSSLCERYTDIRTDVKLRGIQRPKSLPLPYCE